LAGDKSLLPMSLIIIATICMTWTLRHWTTVSRHRAVLALLISLSASWITALACLEGMSRREGVFLRTSKVGPGAHQLRKAARLVRSEAVLAVALYVCAALLARSAHPPLLLIFIICLQGTVYLCAPIAVLWNLRAQRVPGIEYRQRYHQQLIRMAKDRRWSVRIAAPLAALLLAAATGVGFALLAAPSDTAVTPQHVVVAPPSQSSAQSASTPASSGR
jgi:hypothetical protein